MHKLMVLSIIGYCRRQEQAGDCSIPHEFSREQLEQAILALADHIKRIEPSLDIEKLPRADELQAAIDACVKVEGLNYGDDPAAYDEWARQAPIAWATLEALATKEPQPAAKEGT